MSTPSQLKIPATTAVAAAATTDSKDSGIMAFRPCDPEPPARRDRKDGRERCRTRPPTSRRYTTRDSLPVKPCPVRTVSELHTALSRTIGRHPLDAVQVEDRTRRAPRARVERTTPIRQIQMTTRWASHNNDVQNGTRTISRLCHHCLQPSASSRVSVIPAKSNPSPSSSGSRSDCPLYLPCHGAVGRGDHFQPDRAWLP